MITITLPFATPSQNTYQRWHFRKQAKHLDLCRQWIRVGLNNAGAFGAKNTDRRVRVTVQRHSAGELDRGNLIGGCKALIDALRYEGLLVDDKQAWLDDVYEQVPAKRSEGRTVVVIEDAGPGLIATPRQPQLFGAVG